MADSFMPHPLAAQFAREHAQRCDAIVYEQLPNEFRNLPRLPAPTRRSILKLEHRARMTPADWEAWQVSPPVRWWDQPEWRT